MNATFFESFKKYLRLDKLKFDRKLVVFLFFVIASTVFWFLVKLSEDQTATISYSLRFTKPTYDKILLNELPSEMELKVYGTGFKILKNIFASRDVINIDINKLALRKNPEKNSYEYFVLTQSASVKGMIERQAKLDVKILDIIPDSLIFNFSSTVSKKVVIKPVVDMDLEKQYMQNGKIAVSPDSIMVSGPKIIIDTLSYVETKQFSFGILDKTTTRSVRIKTNDNLKYHEKRVQVTVPVERYTEATIDIPIEVINLPDSTSLKTVPTEIKVSYFVALSDYENVKAEHFRAIVDFNSLENNISNKLKVKVPKYPGFISSMKFKPKSVDYYIGK